MTGLEKKLLGRIFQLVFAAYALCPSDRKKGASTIVDEQCEVLGIMLSDEERELFIKELSEWNERRWGC